MSFRLKHLSEKPEYRQRMSPSCDVGELLSQLSALLEYYSGKTVAHASFFVASVFGIFTILPLIHSHPLLSLPYLVLAGGGTYLLLSFRYYSDISEVVHGIIHGIHDGDMLFEINVHGLSAYIEASMIYKYRSGRLRRFFYGLRTSDDLSLIESEPEWATLHQLALRMKDRSDRIEEKKEPRRIKNDLGFLSRHRFHLFVGGYIWLILFPLLTVLLHRSFFGLAITVVLSPLFLELPVLMADFGKFKRMNKGLAVLGILLILGVLVLLVTSYSIVCPFSLMLLSVGESLIAVSLLYQPQQEHAE